MRDLSASLCILFARYIRAQCIIYIVTANRIRAAITRASLSSRESKVRSAINTKQYRSVNKRAHVLICAIVTVSDRAFRHTLLTYRNPSQTE